jgi:uncharacterized protein DUF4399
MKPSTQVALLVAAMTGAALIATAADAKKPAAKAAKKPRVFFIEPKDKATVTSPVHMKFGSEGIEIAAVPKGDVTTARPGIAHYHVGIDQACLPAGKNIVKGTPSWVHFGDGKDEFETQLTPGKHKLALQLGDDKHDTIAGACQVITVDVKP